VDPDKLKAALDALAAEGGGPVKLWVSEPTGATDALAARAGLKRDRDLFQLRRALPVDERNDLDFRSFVPGRDEEAWLEVNNRAFAWHPEQGGWDLATLQAREAEPWFDPAGFLLHEEQGRLAGFCWTKVHADHEPPLGEIYVIAVDPDFAGRGLGRQLTLAGLDYLSRKGLAVGMLYVDEANTAARRLYAQLGFTVDHVDRAYTGSVQPVPMARPTP
jgi:mycothiol synthase